MQLRTVAAALRSAAHLLLPPQEAAALDEALAEALRRPPGRALPVLRRLLLFSPPSPDVRNWVLARLGGPAAPESDPVRVCGDEGDAASDDLPGVDDRVVALWIEERDEDDLRPLDEGHPYTAVLMATADGPDARYSAEVSVPAAEVPAGGLVTRCVLSSTSVRLEADPRDPDILFSTVEAGDRTQWCAAFPFVVPADSDSARHRIRLTPVTAPEARLDAYLFVGDDLYRRLAVSIVVRPASAPAQGEADDETDEEEAAEQDEPQAQPPIAVLTVGSLPAAHAGLVPPSAWQRPASHLDVTVVSATTAMVRCEDFGVFAHVPWTATAGSLETRVANVRGALDRLRQAHGEQLELVSAEDLWADLARHVPSPDWVSDAQAPREPFASAWAAVAESDELRELAFEGYQLYRALFADEELRRYVERLEPGDRLTVNWLEGVTERVPHVPLPLLHLEPVSPGRPVDPSAFLGLRFRLGWMRRQTKGSRALGDWRRTTRAHLLYWVQDPSDVVGAEARRHAEELKRWQPALLLPDGEPRITDLSRFLAAPEPHPVSLLYFYCHCVSGTGCDPRLRLGPTNDTGDVLRRVDMGSDPFTDQPVVFVNACGTNESDPLLVNQLMDGFLDRECRAYIGTEGRVPPGLAARFATAFFSFLYGTTGTDRAPVGESLAQARRFLWQRYRNLGGLFYGYVNDGLLYQADDDHVRRLGAVSTTGEGKNR
ncbi:hypothetical protein ACFVGY_19985 [Streptomyces sp. NPDC127106]|uniref:hypothetical protein n=1 Tax=Streptomyces sp. NPDC127106 TaxID=3345360 RepID=UPI00362BB96B